ncbi:O-antigen ligase family protein [Lysobacter silvisoli]|uniref:O-antigen ligase-related domain-containing protein n=1 Tax=Lysobacter silvisoli TaxID=2293254 RepID=A0A371K353_9GAMM|nr:O-antigen ligase family protein [Lysobacter silvisoli]RDZ28355.1 hypothetical protein DX914_04235 [Lysobacter silvisoli]
MSGPAAAAPPSAQAATSLPAWMRRTAIAALAYTAFFAFADFDLYLRPELGAGLLLLLMCMAGARPWRELRRQPAVWALAALIVYAIAQSLYAGLRVMPALPLSEHLTDTAKLVRLAVFTAVVGWWLSVLPRTLPMLLALMGLGLAASILTYLPWTQLPALWSGALRPEFGVTENLTGLLAAVGGWIALWLAMTAWSARQAGALRLTLAALAYAVCFCVLLFSQSRGAWLAFALVVPAAVLAYAWNHRRAGPLPWLPVLAAASLSVLLLWSARDLVASRFAGSQTLAAEAQQAAVQGSVAIAPSAPAAASAGAEATTAPSDAAQAQQTQVNNKAVGVRMALYRLGVEQWLQRPLLGWGLRSTPELIAQSRRDMAGQHHVHLHNTYLDALVGLGAVGVALLALALLALLREPWRAWRQGRMPVPAFWALAGCVGLVLITNNFDSLLWRFEYGRAPLEFLFGLCLAYGLIRRRAAVGRDGA